MSWAKGRSFTEVSTLLNDRSDSEISDVSRDSQNKTETRSARGLEPGHYLINELTVVFEHIQEFNTDQESVQFH